MSDTAFNFTQELDRKVAGKFTEIVLHKYAIKQGYVMNFV